MNRTLFYCIMTFLLPMAELCLTAQNLPSQDFSFVFMTDIHLDYDERAIDGFNEAIDTVNKLRVDFVLTGGDLISDALKAKQSKADSLYSLYVECMGRIQMPVYNTVGNHELFGIFRESDADLSHPDYNDGMYKRYLGKPYYSFDHKGWHIIVLSSTFGDTDSSYIGYIDEEQINWLKSDLEKIDTLTPIIISSHIPFVTTYGQFKYGSLEPNDGWNVVENSMEILQLFHSYNLKLVLQGHMHHIEYIYFRKIHFLVGGAVSARWWKGPYNGMEEGFMKIDVRGDKISWNYIDFGWEAVKE